MKRFWILWSPQSQQPPKVRYFSESKAREVAQWAARQNPGRDFYVCRAGDVATSQRTYVVSTINKLGR